MQLLLHTALRSGADSRYGDSLRLPIALVILYLKLDARTDGRTGREIYDDGPI